MKKEMSFLVSSSLIFVLFLTLSGLFAGMLSYVFYYAAFLIPISLYFVLCKYGKIGVSHLGVKLKSENTVLTLPLIFPTLLCIFVISFLTELILSRFTEPPVAQIQDNFLISLLTHALFPALFEEILFRYIPISLLLPYGKKTAILYSSVLFALIHCSLYQIPYAFFAGLVFAFVDISFESIIPSVIFHFINNAVSIVWMRGSSERTFVLIFMITLSLCAALSALFIFVKREKYRKILTDMRTDTKCGKFTAEFIVLIILLLSIAFINAFM